MAKTAAAGAADVSPISYNDDGIETRSIIIICDKLMMIIQRNCNTVRQIDRREKGSVRYIIPACSRVLLGTMQ